MQTVYSNVLSELNFSDLTIAEQVLLVTGKKSYDSSVAKSLLEEKLKGRSIKRFSDFQTNPRLEDVRSGLKMLDSAIPCTIIAVGGGSVMDMAKLIKALSNQASDPTEYIAGNKQLVENENINLIAIPTTSGSGSEATHFAVVYIDKVKYSLADPGLLPGTVILDYSLTASMSPYLTACTGFDALAQAVESLWSVNADEESLEYSREAIPLLIANLTAAVNRPSDDNRRAMQHASHLAGKAINLTKTTAAHAFCYYLTSHYGIPHGHAAALLLGKFIVFNSRVTEDDISDTTSSVESVKEILKELFKLLGVKTAEEAERLIEDLLKECSLESELKKIMDLDDRFDDFFNSVNIQRLKNNPRLVNNKNELLELLKN